MATFQQRAELIGIIGRLAARGWTPATAGNFSLRVSESPLVMLMSPSGVDKSQLVADDLIEVSGDCQRLTGTGAVSAEGRLHAAVYKMRPAGCVLHVHTVPNTVLSKKRLSDGYLDIEGYEILKGLTGVTTHEHRERIPIYENSQDMVALSSRVAEDLKENPSTKAFLLAGHGVYTWGATTAQAYQHLEALEFLFETLIRS